MQRSLADIEGTNTQVVAVSYDSVETLKAFAEKGKITFPLLSDEDSKVIDAYGIRNEQVAGDQRLDGIPHPGTFIIGTDGKISGKIFYDGYVRRHTGEQLVEEVRKLK